LNSGSRESKFCRLCRTKLRSLFQKRMPCQCATQPHVLVNTANCGPTSTLCSHDMHHVIAPRTARGTSNIRAKERYASITPTKGCRLPLAVMACQERQDGLDVAKHTPPSPLGILSWCLLWNQLKRGAFRPDGRDAMSTRGGPGCTPNAEYAGRRRGRMPRAMRFGLARTPTESVSNWVSGTARDVADGLAADDE
jgi:hypothetical protein